MYQHLTYINDPIPNAECIDTFGSFELLHKMIHRNLLLRNWTDLMNEWADHVKMALIHMLHYTGFSKLGEMEESSSTSRKFAH